MFAAFIGWWMLRRPAQPQPQPPTTPVPSVAPSPEPSPTVPATAVDREKQYEQRRVDQVHAIITAANVPINFWGKVVDQDDRPVAGVKISFFLRKGVELAPGIPSAKQEKITTETDGSGRFQLTDVRGDAISIDSMVKEGYELSPKVVKSFAYTRAPQIFTPDANSPVIYTMLQKSKPEPLVHYDKAVKVPVDGAPVNFDLWKGVPSPDGELRVSFTRNPPQIVRGGAHFDWSLSAEVSGGGLVEVGPEPMFRAPETDYLDSISMEMRADSSLWRAAVNKSFYLKTRDGKYGRIELRLYADDEGATVRCHVEAHMNPSGSRNLETAH